MAGQPRIRPRRPGPMPRVPSCRQGQFTRTPKQLFFEGPTHTTLRNALGERFAITSGKACFGGYDIELKGMDREAGELRISISIRAYKDKDKVRISDIKCHAPELRGQVHSRPSGENRGFGIIRLALQFAKKAAKEQGITRVTIMPCCFALKEHYINSGFREEPVTDTIREYELVMHLKS